MKSYFTKLVIIFFLSNLLISCAEDTVDDSENPVLSNLSFRNDTVLIGDPLIMTATFADNKSLSNYKMELKANFERIDSLAPYEKMIIGTFYFEDHEQFKKEHILTKSDTIIVTERMTPKGEERSLPVAPGEYTFHLSCTDMSGKEATISKIFVLANKPKGEEESKDK